MTKGEAQQRLFVALWPPAAVRRAVQQWMQGQPLSPARPVPMENLHVTLAFVGRVSPPTRQCLVDALEEVHAEPFAFPLDLLGAWPKPGILWLAPAHPPVELIHLAQQVQARLIPCGYQPETRAYQPHVTLARNWKTPVEMQALTEPLPILWPVEDVVLVESRSARPGPQYRVLERWPLGRKTARNP